MADGTRRTFAQGSKGGWYVVGSERVENGRTKRDYVPEDVAMRAMQGKATDAEIDAAVTTRPSGKKGTAKKDGEATTPRDKKQKQPASSNLPAGRTPKQRDPRLPARGTIIKSRDSKTYVREDAQGTFHLYDAKTNDQLATGKTLTSVMVQHHGKPVNAYSLLGLQTSKKRAQAKKEAVATPKTEPKVESADGKLPHGEWQKHRDYRLPKQGTQMQGKGRYSDFTATETEQGVFEVSYKGTVVSRGKNLTAAWNNTPIRPDVLPEGSTMGQPQNNKVKPATAFTAFGLQPQSEQVTDKETGLVITGKRSPGDRLNYLPKPGTKMTHGEGMGWVIERDDGVFIGYNKDGKAIAASYSWQGLATKMGIKSPDTYYKLRAINTKGDYWKARKERDERLGREPGEGNGLVSVESINARSKRNGDSTQSGPRTKRQRRDDKPIERKPRRRSKRSTQGAGYDKREAGKGKGTAPMSPQHGSYAEHLAYKHFQRKLRGGFRRAAESTIGIDQKGWTKLRLDIPDGRQFVVKTSPDRKQTWAKEKGPDAKPFKVTDAWVQQMQNVRASKAGKLPDTGNNKNRAISVKNTVKKAFSLAEQECSIGACEVFLDGIVMRGLAGDVAGFVPFMAAAGSTISADEITKAVAEVITTKEVRVSLESVTQALGDKPAETDGIAALYAAVGGIHADETEKAVDGNTAPRKGYPKKQGDYADKDQYKYPIETESHVKAALSYFGNPDNRKMYSEDKQREIARRILSAAKRFGIDIDEQSEVGKLARVARRD